MKPVSFSKRVREWLDSQPKAGDMFGVHLRETWQFFSQKKWNDPQPMSVEEENALMLEMLQTVLYEGTSDFDRERDRVRCWPLHSKTYRWIGRFLKEKGLDYPYGRTAEDILRQEVECVKNPSE